MSRTETDTLVRHKQMKSEIRFRTCNVRNKYRSCSLIAAARELTRYELDLVGVQEVRWGKGGTVRVGDYGD